MDIPPQKIHDFFEILRALNKFIISEEFKSITYNNLFKTGLDCNTNEILDFYCNFNQDFSYHALVINIWNFFWYVELKKFDLSLKSYDKTIEITNKVNTDFFEFDIEAAYDIDELIFNLSIFNTDRVINDFDQFIEIMKILILGLIHEENFNNQIFKLTINGKCTSNQFIKPNSIFPEKNLKISEIKIEDLHIESNKTENPKSPVITFIEKFYSLEKLGFIISYIPNKHSFIKLLKNKIVRNKLDSLKFDKYEHITKNIAISIVKLKALRKLCLSYLPISNSVLRTILGNNKIQESLTELSLIEINCVDINNAKAISNFKKIEKLNLGISTLTDSVLQIIFDSAHLKKSLKELFLRNSIYISAKIAKLISNFEVLEKIDINFSFISSDSLGIILSNDKLKKSIKDMTFYPYYDFFTKFGKDLIQFSNLERFSTRLSKYNLEAFTNLLDEEKFRKFTKELIVTEYDDDSSYQSLTKISNIESLEAFSIMARPYTPINFIINILQNVKFHASIKKLVITGFIFEEDQNLDVFSKFENLKILEFSGCYFLNSTLSKILSFKNLKKSVTELYLRNCNNFKNDDAKNIAEFENLEVLDFYESNFTKETLSVLLNSKNLQKSIKTIRFKWHIYGNPDLNQFSAIGNFESLENFFFSIHNDYFDTKYLYEILQNEKPKNTLKKFTIHRYDYFNTIKSICNENYINFYDEEKKMILNSLIPGKFSKRDFLNK
ncbi:hypothetical protein DMUE_3470 [Dictyocoela muelleri]|nr:hypothetical protein DMUE_3470 [Dictyocoela muelleri]